MENRLVRYFIELDALLAPDTEVGPDHPLTLWIGRDVLAEVLEDNLANIDRNRTPEAERPAEREQLDRIAAERRAFLRWVRAWQGVNLFVGLFPCTEYEPEENVSDLTDRSDDDGTAESERPG